MTRLAPLPITSITLRPPRTGQRHHRAVLRLLNRHTAAVDDAPIFEMAMLSETWTDVVGTLAPRRLEEELSREMPEGHLLHGVPVAVERSAEDAVRPFDRFMTRVLSREQRQQLIGRRVERIDTQPRCTVKCDRSASVMRPSAWSLAANSYVDLAPLCSPKLDSMVTK